MSVEIGSVVEVVRATEWGSYNCGQVTVNIGDSGWVTELRPDHLEITLAKNMARIPFKTFPEAGFRIIKV